MEIFDSLKVSGKNLLEKVEKQVGGNRMDRVEITVFEKYGCKSRERNIVIGGKRFFFFF